MHDTDDENAYNLWPMAAPRKSHQKKNREEERPGKRVHRQAGWHARRDRGRRSKTPDEIAEACPAQRPKVKLQIVELDLRTYLWKYPDEMVAKIDDIAARLGLELKRNRGHILPGGELYFQALGELVREIFLGETPPLGPDGDRRAAQHLTHLAWLLRDARKRATERLRRRPDVPLGLPPDKLGYWSNLISASWFDPSDHPELGLRGFPPRSKRRPKGPPSSV
jgi:hypothetical protein